MSEGRKILSIESIQRKRVGVAHKRRQAVALVLSLLVVCFMPAKAGAQQAGSATRVASARAVADAVRLVTEFEVNGLKVLVKRREGS